MRDILKLQAANLASVTLANVRLNVCFDADSAQHGLMLQLWTAATVLPPNTTRHSFKAHLLPLDLSPEHKQAN